MNKENLNLNRIQEFLSFYSNNSSLGKIIEASNYDSYIIRCKNGSKIHIKKKTEESLPSTVEVTLQMNVLEEAKTAQVLL